MLKRIFIWTSSILFLFIVLIVGIVLWQIEMWPNKLIPPNIIYGQVSIASYAKPLVPRRSKDEKSEANFDWSSIVNPPKSARAWTRWWWPGGYVDAQALSEQLHELDNAGFGGAEIQPFAMGLNVIKDDATRDRIYEFDTPSYYVTLNRVMTEAESLNWQIDLTHFSGWPAGGPEVNLDDSITAIVYSQTQIQGGKTVSLPLPRPKAGPNEYITAIFELAGDDFINFPADHARVLSVIAAKRAGGHRSANPFNLEDTLALAEESVLVLTDKVADGVLHWQAPEGDWEIVTSFIMPSAEPPIGPALRPSGFVVDPLRLPQLYGHYEYAYGERTGLTQHHGKALRGFFNDSLEFRLKRMSAVDIIDEFRIRRGYDIEPYLPVVYREGIDNMYFAELLGIHAAPEFSITSLDERIRYDYQLTLSDLMIERFIEGSAAWAGSKGMISRGQTYGMDLDVLRGLGANDIPEVEQLWAGGSNVVLKLASSAAALYGKPLVSAESFVWRTHDYTSTPRKLKVAADKMFLAGINHIIYHGTPYRFPDTDSTSQLFGPEGWSPFSGPENQGHFSGNISAGNTSLWPDIPALNNYIARSQNLLRQGHPSLDVLVYYPFLGFRVDESPSDEALLYGRFADAGPDSEAGDVLSTVSAVFTTLMSNPEHADGRAHWLATMRHVLEELDRRGLTWGWVNAHAIESGKVGKNTLSESAGKFGAILVANVTAIAPSTLDSLNTLSAQGAKVILAGETPVRQLGYHNAQAGDAGVAELVDLLRRHGVPHYPLQADLLVAQLYSEIQPTLQYSQPSDSQEVQGIRQYRRILGEGEMLYFFANQSKDPQRLALDLATEGTQKLWWFDALDGRAWPAVLDDGAVELQLDGFASRFLISGRPLPDRLGTHAANGYLFSLSGQATRLADWRVEWNGVARRVDTLLDWREIPELKHESGPVTYRHKYIIDGHSATNLRYLLNLGLVHGSAKVKVNGKLVGQVSLPPFICDISPYLKTGANEIEVIVRAPLRNEFVGKGLADDAHYAHMKGYAEQTIAAGLIGPVSIAVISKQ